MNHSLLGAGGVAAAIALVGCGGDYYYVEPLDIEGDVLVATFVFTCPGVRLAWDGSFRAERHADFSVQTANGGCDDQVEASFDLAPMKRALVATQKDPPGLIDIRVPGYDDSQEPRCATYYFSLRDLDQPGSGYSIRCP
jgi:hypothetical protein